MLSAVNQTSIIIASVSAAVTITICICIIIFKGNLPFTFSRRKTPTSQFDLANEIERDVTEGKYRKYGELYIAPDKQPTVAALDIMTRILICPGLPGCAKTATGEKRTESTPRFSVQLLSSESVVSSPSFVAGEQEQKNERCCFDGRDARHSFKAERIRAGQWADVAKESIRKEDEDAMLDPTSFIFSDLYGKQ